MSKRKLTRDEVALFPPFLIKVFDLFSASNKEIYLVGAGVRAILSGKVPVNCDLTTNATPQETLEIMKDFEPFYENDFGMVGVSVENSNEEIYEITTYRSEKGYSDFRRPDEVVWGKTIEEDVVRRDFTMNAVLVGPIKNSKIQSAGWRIENSNYDYEMVDLVEGIEDFDNGIIRTVGEPELRFGEDALRMMRAIRFASTLGFVIEPKTLAAISMKASLLSKISRERVRDELLKIIGSDYPAEGMRLLINTGLMGHIIPEVLLAKGVDQNGHHTLEVLEHMLGALANCPSKNVIVRLATFLHDIGKATTKRFHCTNCGKIIRDNPKDEGLYCENCHTPQTRREATTFYGHEVVGEKMVERIGEDLRLPNKDKEKMKTLVRWHMFTYQRNMTDAAIRRLIRNVGKENINDLMLLRIGDRKGGGSKTTSWRLLELQKRIGEQLYEPMEIRDMVIKGTDIMEILGIKGGPKVGEILRKLFEEVIEDTSKNNKEYLTRRVAELFPGD